MNNEIWRYQLLQALESELSAAVALRSLLSREEATLSEGRLDDLEALIRAKEAAIENLDSASEHRTALAKGLSHGGGVESLIEQLCGADASGHPLQELWPRLRSEIEACAELNRQNEILNRAGQRRVKQLLRLMNGQPIDPLTYEGLVGKT
ncbi:flagella synthesis protein FlgN [Acidihalobacter ferrooxydans]|uniref:Flagellar biosynthesis protein FlgN n=1 Tax=Acidihalobacter ferrooxydans TaxID=1765967 RepID=A0A1P8UGS7_9GAMM|nr:flagellar protein FlgN [Acidihalobacter ferrooxydans]APZ43035.1 hypothetical protein BW247_07955 [Acidihalobacter ferrooxydans]